MKYYAGSSGVDISADGIQDAHPHPFRDIVSNGMLSSRLFQCRNLSFLLMRHSDTAKNVIATEHFDHDMLHVLSFQ